MCNRYTPPREPLDERPRETAAQPLFPRWKPKIGPWGQGPFVVAREAERVLEVGQWALIGDKDEKSNMAPRMTNCARWESVASRRTYSGPWARGQRCVVPAESVDYPNWESGRNVWWTLRRADRQLLLLAGIWNEWKDPRTGELLLSYALVTQNCDGHPLLARFHAPDPDLPADAQDKRTVVPLDERDLDLWLRGSAEDASGLVKLPPGDYYEAGPTEQPARSRIDEVDPQGSLFD